MALVKRNHFAASPGILLRISVGLAGFAQKQRVMFVEVITAHLEDAPMDLNARNKKRRRIRVGSWPWVGVENVKKMKNQKISRTGGFGRLQNAVQSRAKKLVDVHWRIGMQRLTRIAGPQATPIFFF